MINIKKPLRKFRSRGMNPHIPLYEDSHLSINAELGSIKNLAIFVVGIIFLAILGALMGYSLVKFIIPALV